ncbi:MAG: cell wall metabolism sensor histidine kinase WalK [Tissierellaceae bacterium]|nr:cell wall metabolism sensor histidine kinase WalK [Tissierellaceae bacterium]
MFSSIKWKFILVYFLLVFIAMVIVAVFIIQRTETKQLEHITDTMNQHIETIISASSYITEDDWTSVRGEIQKTINEWRLDGRETLYVINNADVPTIIASTSKNYDTANVQNALSYKSLDPTLILKALDGKKNEGLKNDFNENIKTKHIAYPVFNEVGKVKGILYMISDLSDVYQTIDEFKAILTNATLLALGITIFLGFLIANSITGPIKDVTVKAEKMAKGDFEQFVQVKSDDEIGQLASMFNYLTLKLKSTIEEMDVERSKLNTILKYMTDGVVAIDTDGNIIHANPIASKVLGLNYDDIQDSKKTIPFPEDKISIKMFEKEKTDKIEGDKIIEIHDEVYKMGYAPFKNEKNNVAGLIIVFQDITKEHKLDNMRKEFVANVSHELKTPITTIKSYTETLMNGYDLDRELSNKFFSVIDNECDRMARIVSDLLQLSNLDYNKTKWKKVNLSVKKVIDDVCLKLEPLIEDKGHTLSIDIEKDISDIVADKDGIEQVILNVLSNSIKYTPNNGEIRIKARQENDKVIISVKDNGIGIPDEDQKRIFERFYRVDKARSRELGGTGLGLSIAKQIIEEHKGNIILKSKYKEGTEVDIILPLNKDV